MKVYEQSGLNSAKVINQRFVQFRDGFKDRHAS